VRKLALPLALLLFACVAACSFPADKPAHQWVKFVRKYQAKVEDGSFKRSHFVKEGKPIAEDLAKRRDEKAGVILLSDDIRDDFKQANLDFIKACEEAGNEDAKEAFREVASIFAETEEDKSEPAQ
jgi:hypothetical protein